MYVSECVTSRHIFGGDSILSLERGWVALIVPRTDIHEGRKNIPEKMGKWRSGRGQGKEIPFRAGGGGGKWAGGEENGRVFVEFSLLWEGRSRGFW